MENFVKKSLMMEKNNCIFWLNDDDLYIQSLLTAAWKTVTAFKAIFLRKGEFFIFNVS